MFLCLPLVLLPLVLSTGVIFELGVICHEGCYILSTASHIRIAQRHGNTARHQPPVARHTHRSNPQMEHGRDVDVGQSQIVRLACIVCCLSCRCHLVVRALLVSGLIMSGQPAVPSQQLSDEEAAIYDRQLRIWGVEAQTRMRASRVLLIGMGGLAAEIAKNLVLTGVGALTLLDTVNTSPLDLASQFFLTAADVGNNRATASLSRLQQLNSNVAIDVVTAAVSSLPDSFFLQYHSVVATELPLSSRVRLCGLFRSPQASLSPPRLYAADLDGFSAVLVSDLVRHRYTASRKVNDGGGRQVDVKAVEGEQQWDSYEEVIAMQEADIRKQCGRKTVDREAADTFIAARERLRAEEAADGQTAAGEYSVSGACAIFGGLVAQEVLKVMSGKEEPHQNAIIVNALTGTAVVKHLQPHKQISAP